jgi:hypothetical protein
MINLLANLKAFCLAALSLCLGLIVLGSGLQAQAQETNAKVGDERREDSNQSEKAAAAGYKFSESNITCSSEKKIEWTSGVNVVLFSTQAFERTHVGEIIYHGVRISGSGKQVLFNSTISRQVAGEILAKHLSAT